MRAIGQEREVQGHMCIWGRWMMFRKKFGFSFLFSAAPEAGAAGWWLTTRLWDGTGMWRDQRGAPWGPGSCDNPGTSRSTCTPASCLVLVAFFSASPGLLWQIKLALSLTALPWTSIYLFAANMLAAKTSYSCPICFPLPPPSPVLMNKTLLLAHVTQSAD